MKASIFLEELHKMEIDTIAGVPDSTLKQLCDAIQLDNGNMFKHYVTANEGAAVGLATGVYLATGRPACIYMQNSGEGNIINPLASIANDEVYGIPMLFLIGWRGEPGVKDEPQHVYQGKVTCELLEVMNVSYRVIDKDTTLDELRKYLNEASECFSQHKQFAIVIKKGTFEPEASFNWENGYTLIREQALRAILEEMYD
ncbi:MAG: thiamine pyrophosphate-binding protein, partial [Coprococcus sp.]